jgi:hypothetical protein
MLFCFSNAEDSDYIWLCVLTNLFYLGVLELHVFALCVMLELYFEVHTCMYIQLLFI